MLREKAKSKSVRKPTEKESTKLGKNPGKLVINF